MTVAALPAEAVIDLGAVRDNVAALRAAAPGAQLLAVVKADGYGHGMVPVARAALAGGADWLGVAFLTEAMALRAAGI
ncbi:MAG: alanine racemase, partial [Mycobacteriales bacterium]